MNIRYLVLLFILMLGNVIADDVTESEPNNTIATALNVDSHFSAGANPDITNATTWPWVSIDADGDGNNDYFSFTVPVAGVTGIFDVDYGHGMGGSVDTEMCLYAIDGSVLAENDDASSSAAGSIIGGSSARARNSASSGAWLAQAASMSVVKTIENPRNRSRIGAFPLVALSSENLAEPRKALTGTAVDQHIDQPMVYRDSTPEKLSIHRPSPSGGPNRFMAWRSARFSASRIAA